MPAIPEVIGTLGQVPDKFHLVSSVEDVEKLQVENTTNLSYVTQTTLSVDECRDIVGALAQAVPAHQGTAPGRYLLCDAESPERREGIVQARRRDSRHRFPEQLELQPLPRVG